MAHHDSTPETVLNAPSKTVEYIHEHTGESRQERRHDRTPSGKWYFIPKRYQARSFNTPYEKDSK